MIGAHYSLGQMYAAQQQAAFAQLDRLQMIGQLQKAGLNQMHRDNLLRKSKTRQERVSDMERDLSSWLSRNEKITINL